MRSHFTNWILVFCLVSPFSQAQDSFQVMGFEGIREYYLKFEQQIFNSFNDLNINIVMFYTQPSRGRFLAREGNFDVVLATTYDKEPWYEEFIPIPVPVDRLQLWAFGYHHPKISDRNQLKTMSLLAISGTNSFKVLEKEFGQVADVSDNLLIVTKKLKNQRGDYTLLPIDWHRYVDPNILAKQDLKLLLDYPVMELDVYTLIHSRHQHLLPQLTQSFLKWRDIE